MLLELKKLAINYFYYDIVIKNVSFLFLAIYLLALDEITYKYKHQKLIYYE